MRSGMDTILSVHELHYRYPGPGSGLSDVSCGIPAGRRTVFLGANGAGKSTLLHALSGVLRPQRGEVRYQGQPLDYSREGMKALRSRIGLVMQQPDVQLFCPQVFQDVAYGPTNLGLSPREVRERVEDALEAVGVAGCSQNPVHCLSYGEKQRVAIAGVLAMQPAVMLLDEPTAELDSAGIDALLVELEKLRRNGATLVMATHDIDLAWRWGDHFLVMEEGRVKWEGEHGQLARDTSLFEHLNLRMPTVGPIYLSLVRQGMISSRHVLPRDAGELVELLETK